MTDKELEQGFDWATRVALSKSVEHVTTAVTSNPAVGKVAGQATGAAYSYIPEPVKGGAALGGVVAVSGWAHAVTIGTAGAAAFAPAFLVAAPVFIAGGAVLGGLLWLFGDDSKG